MNVLDKAGLTKLCTKIKEIFATKSELGLYVGGSNSLKATRTNTDLKVTLNNANGSPNTELTIGCATTEKAGVMSAQDKKTLNIVSDMKYQNMSYILYSELKNLRDNSQLVEGRYYRITDFVTTVDQENARSAGHPFDIIVLATSPNTLNENAFAIQNDDTTYFSQSNLDAWELKYDLDNDKSKYAWADETNGKGVIYYMKDEWNNECFYDFKNVQYKRYRIEDVIKQGELPDSLISYITDYLNQYVGFQSDAPGGNLEFANCDMKQNLNDYRYYYTFSSYLGEEENITDWSLLIGCINNKIYVPNINYAIRVLVLNNIVIFDNDGQDNDNCKNNIFNECVNITIFGHTICNSKLTDIRNSLLGAAEFLNNYLERCNWLLICSDNCYSKFINVNNSDFSGDCYYNSIIDCEFIYLSNSCYHNRIINSSNIFFTSSGEGNVIDYCEELHIRGGYNRFIKSDNIIISSDYHNYCEFKNVSNINLDENYTTGNSAMMKYLEVKRVSGTIPPDIITLNANYTQVLGLNSRGELVCKPALA